MALFKCKMCGGTLEINGQTTVATCEYCGTQQTLPKLDDDRRANMYDRANHFRRNNAYDKAMAIYEQILNEDKTDAEAYWSLVLCRYGIEYVEDPATRKRIPTVNRVQYTSIFDDGDYKSALQYAHRDQRALYEGEAAAINEIQKGILAVSQKEAPFDVFICYKETDENGRRTPDSVLANDLYHQLTAEGFKVFFSRITLEDKLGTAYEPYIFAALNSAKVMVVLGTKPGYFEAVWVRNEWSRYLSLIRQGQKKILIPAYRDMDPYDLPEEFSHLQAQDMSKLGFMQDLIRGIKKLVPSEKPAVVKETVIAEGQLSIAPLLKRAFMFLEDGDWASAEEYCEKVLDRDPENAMAYVGKLLSGLKVRRQEELKEQAQPFDGNNNYQKALRFADEKLSQTLTGYITHIRTRNEQTRLTGTYHNAQNIMAGASTESEYKEAAQLFASIGDYQDAPALARTCYEKAEVLRKDAILAQAKAKMMRPLVSDCETALQLFTSISGWKDADELACACREKIEALKLEEEADRLERERRKEMEQKASKRIARRKTIIATLLLCAGIGFVIVYYSVIAPANKYKDALAQIDSGNYWKAYEAFLALDSYKDSAEKAKFAYKQYQLEKLRNAKTGDYVVWGTYEQDNDTKNGKEAIEWLVLEVKDGKALVISKYALDVRQYHTSNAYVTWKICTLRNWLNDEFINTAFSADEKEMIPTVTVLPDGNPDYTTDPGYTTRDRVFLLSMTEAKHYFGSDDARQCRPTGYATANISEKNYSDFCRWWLRTPGSTQESATYVDDYGIIDEEGSVVELDYCAVRPAMWIELPD